MSQPLEDIADARESPADIPEVDREIASILSEIEQERVPERLLALANKLQAVLARKKPRLGNLS